MRPKGIEKELSASEFIKNEDEHSIYPKDIIFPQNSGPFYGLQVEIQLHIPS